MFSNATTILWHVIDFLETYNGAITALATIAIGVFTFVLVLVTRRQAILTKQSVRISERALIELERPFIVIDKIESNIAFFLDPGTIWNEATTNPHFTVSVINYGRTPGNIEFAALFVVVRDKVPDQATRLHVVTGNPEGESIEIIIGPGSNFSFPTMRIAERLTHANVTDIKAGSHSLYCHGVFTYVDIFGSSHTTRFCRRYWRERDEWPPEGGRERNRVE